MRQQGRTSPRTPYSTEYRNRKGFSQTIEDYGERLTRVELRAGGVPADDSPRTLEVYKNGFRVGAQNILDLIEGANVTLTVTDDGTAIRVEIAATGGGSNGYDIIEDEGTPLAQESVIDFVGAGVTATAGAGKTVVTIPGGAAHDQVTLDADAAVILDLIGQEIGLDTQTPNTVLAGPSSGAVNNEPTFRALVVGDIPKTVDYTWTANHLFSGGIAVDHFKLKETAATISGAGNLDLSSTTGSSAAVRVSPNSGTTDDLALAAPSTGPSLDGTIFILRPNGATDVITVLHNQAPSGANAPFLNANSDSVVVSTYNQTAAWRYSTSRNGWVELWRPPSAGFSGDHDDLTNVTADQHHVAFVQGDADALYDPLGAAAAVAAAAVLDGDTAGGDLGGTYPNPTVSGKHTHVNSEVPSGTVDGVNVTFTLAATPTAGSLQLYLTGYRLKLTTDYTLSAATITFVNPPPPGALLLADYRT